MSNHNSNEMLVHGLLNQFSSLRDLEETITNLTIKQDELLGKSIRELDYYQSNEELAEINLMVKI